MLCSYFSQAAEKLSLELPEGAIVIEYTGVLRHQAGLKKVAQVIVPVSWNEQQKLHVYVKEGGGR